MKNSILNILRVAVLATLIFFSCDNQTEADLLTESNNLEAICKTIGEEHNKGLEYVYEQLKEVKLKSGEINRSDFQEMARKHTIDFLEKNQLSFVKENIDISISEAQKSFIRVEKEYSFNSLKLKNRKSENFGRKRLRILLQQNKKNY